MLISEIIGIEEKYVSLLKKEGITHLEELLPLSTYKLKQIAEKTGIPVKLLDTWQEYADLMRIEGITSEYAFAINEIGIDSVKELANRNVNSTLEKLSLFQKKNPKILKKTPSIEEIELWIKHANQIKDLPPTTKPKKEEKEKEDFGNYGPEYWNNKWIKSPIIYTGRALRGEEYNTQIDVDVKAFIKNNDEILNYIIQERDLKKPTHNETALACQQFVCNFLKYKFDEESSECPEFWQFPFESIQFGIGDCIAHYEEIYTKEGIKQIGNLKIGDIILSYDFKNKEFCYKPITKIWEKGKLEICRILLRNGQTLDVSENHPFWIRQNQKESFYEKSYLKDIDLSKWWKRKTPIAKKIPYEIKDIEWISEELSFVIGHFLAEGWHEKDGKIRSSGYDVLDEIIPILEKNEIPYSEYTNTSGVPCITFLKSEFKSFLRLFKENSYNIHIPEEIFHLPERKLEALINGFYLGDGHNGNYPDKRGYISNKQEVLSTSSRRLANDIQRIGLQLGRTFHIWKQVKHGGFGKKPIYRITYNPKSHFLKDFGYKNISEVSIREYEKIGSTRMLDFEVKDTNSYVFKNGIIGHNCEDGAILIAALMINAGVPSFRVKVCAGSVLADPKVAPSEDNIGGHGYAIYLADRKDSDRGLEWVILDWCYIPDPEIQIDKKPLAKNGGTDGAYQDVWFTFNDEFSWSQNDFEITQGRISNKQKAKKKEVGSEIKNMVERVLKDLGLDIE
ncbi:MAG: DUF4332 domain-containing protein [Candidatus Lokiarchaeota archaeon]|nr:DUF4332 domain-containing protein [Candidatus Lokiarchaeota archaeon]